MSLTNPKVISIGEVLIDFIAQEKGSIEDVTTFQKCPGGAPANFAVGLARLSVDVAFVGKVGDDVFGEYLKKTLENEGVITDHISKGKPDERTALAFVSLDKDAERNFLFYRNNAADLKLTKEDIPLDKISKAKYLHLGSVSLTDNPCRDTIFEVIEVCKEAGVKICFDPNIRLDLWENELQLRKTLEKVLPFVDICYPSKEELFFILDKTTSDEQEAINLLMEKYPIDIVALKLGIDGCLIKKRDDFFLSIPSFDVPVIDTTGAGDGFNAGFIFALVNDRGLEVAGIMGNAVGALVIQQKGAMSALPTNTDLAVFLIDHKVKLP
ncbi:MAG: carbohydrate kinase [Asgard group archaeon]|nr:carbohydrate kinase [Asgard group archaeon]